MSTTNYHTPKAADGTTMEAADVNTPLGELDAAITANVASTLANAALIAAEEAARLAHEADSRVHGVSGDVVGTSDTQVLTEKTINSGENTIAIDHAASNYAPTDDDIDAHFAGIDAELGMQDANQTATAAQVATNTADIQALGGSGLGDWGGANASEFFLLSHWLDAIGRPAGSPTYNDDGVITSMNVTWPDGTSGVYTATAIDSTWLEATAWTLTHSASGQTVTASGLMRNADGEITTPLSFTVS